MWHIRDMRTFLEILKFLGLLFITAVLCPLILLFLGNIGVWFLTWGN
jgi:hypothetical protein